MSKSERGSCGEPADLGETKPKGTIHQVEGGPGIDEARQIFTADTAHAVSEPSPHEVQTSAGDSALPEKSVDPQAQTGWALHDVPLAGTPATAEESVQHTPSSETEGSSLGLRRSGPGAEETSTIRGANHESKAEGSRLEREASEEEVRPAIEIAPALAAPVPAVPEQATAAVVPLAGASGAHSQTTAPEISALSQAVDAIGAKGSSAQPEHALRAERAESLGEHLRPDTPTETGNETSGSTAGTEAKPAPKTDQTWLASPSPASGAPPPVPPAEASAPNPPIRVVSEVPLGAVPVEIGLKSLAGVNHFEIRLDPVELGRIEVRLEIDAEGGVKAHMSVDRVETLALLQRDAKTLERAFDQAGLKLSDGSVDLSLRDQHSQGQGRHEHAGDGRRDGSRHPRPDIRHEHADRVLAEAPRRLWGRPAGIDVRI